MRRFRLRTKRVYYHKAEDIEELEVEFVGSEADSSNNMKISCPNICQSKPSR